MHNKKPGTALAVPGKMRSIWLLLRPEDDLAGGGVHTFHDSQRFQLDAGVPNEFAALLEALLDADADALHSGAGVLYQFDQSLQGAAIGQKVVE